MTTLSRTKQDTLPNLYDLSLAEMERLLTAWGQPAYRARQIFRQLYVNLVDTPLAMTDLPLALRERLVAETCLAPLAPEQIQTADNGLTRKALFRLPSGALVESVLMIYPDRATVCVSTQAGCAMGCVFCATGTLGLLRNLSPGEMVAQVVWAAREMRRFAAGRQSAQTTRLPEDDAWWTLDDPQDDAPSTPDVSSVSRLTNIVFMGMGEPFANYDRWWRAVEIIHDPRGLNIGARSMTVSTVGLVPGIRRLATESLPINLAISLHAPDDDLRSALMPVNRRYPLAALLDATRDYLAATGRRVSFEYVLLQEKNDAPEHAAKLAALLRGEAGPVGLPLHLVHVNLIPWNPVPGMPLGRSERRRVLTFQRILREHGIACTVRVERGVTIAAACGQLAGGGNAAR
ncbi:MAG: radical SAM protein [Roseiflexus sp.]|nr:radical SAM protein [Roseiflexus sp.]MCS7289495.1 radical SAM protein [Roseiflexus sp.]MDW8147399.1 radical SAM protein [Roseiflexaceae bacterium]MDW8234442.1 radical SAM protein [Roseiflexaceae bacterium]